MQRFARWFRTSASADKTSAHPARQRHTSVALEFLEDRTLPSVDLTALANGIAGPLTALENSLNTVRTVRKLPIINRALDDLVQPLYADVQKLRTGLQSAIAQFPQGDGSQAQAKLAQSLGSTFGLLGNTVAFGDGGDSVTVTLHVKKEFTAGNPLRFDFGLGLPGIPLGAEAGGNVQVRLGIDYDGLQFGVRNQQFFFDAGRQRFTITADALTDVDLKGSLGFLKFGIDPNAPDTLKRAVFHGDFTMGVMGTGRLTNPQLTGSATVDLRLLANFMAHGDLNFPSVSTDFHLDWNFNSADPNAAALTGFGEAPNVAFNNVSLRLGSYLSDLVGPVIDKVKQATAPLKPIVDALNTPLPGLTDLNNLFHVLRNQHTQNWDVTLLSLAEVVQQTHVLPPDIDLILQLSITLAQVTQTIHNFSSNPAVGGLVLNLGNFNLGSPQEGNGDLRGLRAAGDVANLANPMTDLRPLHATATRVLDQVSGAIPDPQLRAAAVGFLSPPNPNNGIQIEYPLLNDPQSFFPLFLGQDVDLIRFTLHMEMQSALPQGSQFLFYGAPVHFDGSLAPFVHVQVGYDTRGLRQFIDSVIHHSPDASKLLNGLYVSGDTRLAIGGRLSAGVSTGIPVFSVEVSGDISADVGVRMHNPQMLDKMHKDQIQGCLFDVSGSLSAGLDVTVKIGVDVWPVGFVGVEYPFHIARGTLVNFNFGCVGNPFEAPQGLQLAGVTNGVLTLFMGPNANQRNYQTGQIDEVFAVSHAAREPNDPQGEAVYVSAFGYSIRYTGVQSISADTGDGNDEIRIDRGVLSPAILVGGSGSKRFSYLGSGEARMTVGNGDNILNGGSGRNTFQAGGGNNTLIGGTGANDFLVAGDGNNILTGGPVINNLTVFGNGNNRFTAGDGPTTMFLSGTGRNSFLAGRSADTIYVIGEGDNTISWAIGNGPLTIRTDAPPTTRIRNALQITGSDGDDTFVVDPYGQNDSWGVSVLANGVPIRADVPVQKVGIEGGRGRDRATVNDLGATTHVQEVGINLSQALTPDRASDLTVVNGAPDYHTITVKTDKVTVQVCPSEFVPHPCRFGGVMSVQTRPPYQVHTAIMDQEDDLVVNTRGTGNTINLLSNTGHTVLNGDPTSGGDAFNISSNAPANSGVLFDVTTPAPLNFGLYGLVEIHAGGGSNRLLVSESGFTGISTINLTDAAIYGTVRQPGPPRDLPFRIQYDARGNFAGGVGVATGPGTATVNVRSLPAGTRGVVASLGDDTINISSDAPTNAGTLDSLRSPLALGLTNRTRRVNISDRGRTTPQRVTMTATEIRSDAWRFPVELQVIAGTFQGTLALSTGSGRDTVTVNSTLAGGSTTINTAGGSDVINVRVAANSAYNLAVYAGSGGRDVLNILDTSGGAVIHDHASGPASGTMEVCYLTGPHSFIRYTGVERTMQDPDADESYVQALYHTILHRNGTTAEVRSWLPTLHRPGGRAAVAEGIERSPEARRNVVRGWFRQFLNKSGPTTPAEQSLENTLIQYMQSSTGREEEALRRFVNAVVDYDPDLESELPPQVFMQRRRALVTFVYQRLLSRGPSTAEMTRGVSLLAHAGPGDLAYQIVTGREYRTQTIRQYFSTILHRSAAAAEIDALASRSDDLLKIRVGMESGPEFHDNGC